MRLVPNALVALSLMASFGTAQIVVPTDYSTLDQAVAAAPSGGIILVRTTSTQPFITIDKSLTIIGEPVVNIDYWCNNSAGPVRLNGPGNGKVELINFVFDRSVDCSNPTPGIVGGGFTDLVLQNCDISETAAGLTGAGNGAAGISVGVSTLIVQDSVIAGRGPDSDQCRGFLFTGVEPGISAPGATVILLDSTVRGGSGGFLCCDNCACPGSLSGLGGEGGDGVICESLFVANSSVSAGVGSTFYANNGGMSTNCGKQPDGENFVVNLYANLGNDLTLNGPVRIGSFYNLTWNSTGPATALYLAFGFSTPPRYFGSGGWSFGDGTAFRLATFVGGGPVSLNLPVPPNPGLLGADIMFQIVDSTDGLSRPVTAIIEN